MIRPHKSVLNIDLRFVPFSRRGSYLALSILDAGRNRPAGLYIRTVRGAGKQHLLHVCPAETGIAHDPEISCDGALLRMEWKGALVEICFTDPRVIRIRGRKGPLRLSVPDPGLWEYGAPVSGDTWRINLPQRGCALSLRCGLGDLSVRSPLRMRRRWGKMHQFASCVQAVASPGRKGLFDLTITDITEDDRPVADCRSFAADVKAVRAHLRDWTAKLFPSRTSADGRLSQLGAYILWSTLVDPSGHLTRPAMLMSKNRMAGVWSWDHCFNAIALARAEPGLAVDQLLLPFDNQRPDGCLPDRIDAGQRVLNFCKPPIHGWAALQLLERGVPIRALSRQLYLPLAAWTRWWFECRDTFGIGLPHYLHGNDSGWDNATPFDRDLPLITPDLPSFLVLQCEALARLAQHAGDKIGARRWKEKSEQLLDRLLRALWNGQRFVALTPATGKTVATSSLLFLMPVILGRRLPKIIFDTLVARLMEPAGFLSEWGPASESLDSPHFVEDGYWRGAVWAPTVILLADGLRSGQRLVEAAEVGGRFLSAVRKSGFSENFSPRDGKALCDPAYSWTASAAIILGEDNLLPIRHSRIGKTSTKDHAHAVPT